MKFFIRQLVAADRNQLIPSEHDIFGHFIGSWNLKLRICHADKEDELFQGHWNFSRILNGLAVQDVWYVRDARGRTHECGTTVRTYNPTTGKWQAAWFGPLQNQFFTLDIEQLDDKILLKANNTSGFQMQWFFEEISQNSFHWKSQISLDDSCTWRTNYAMKVNRLING